MTTSLTRRFSSLSLGLALIGGGCWSTSIPPAASPEPAPAVSSTAPTPSSTASATTTPVKTTVKTKAAPKPVAHTVTVQILSGRFSPQVIAAAAGDTVVWTNKDTVPHTSHSDNVLLWDTGSLAPGKSGSHTFPSAGTYPYSDANTGIKGTVVIH